MKKVLLLFYYIIIIIIIFPSTDVEADEVIMGDIEVECKIKKNWGEAIIIEYLQDCNIFTLFDACPIKYRHHSVISFKKITALILRQFLPLHGIFLSYRGQCCHCLIGLK